MNQIARSIAARLLALSAVLTVGCSPMSDSSVSPPAVPPLAGANIGGPVALTDQDGAPFGERNLSGRYRIMYFGYTFCPDVCPVDVQNLAAGLKAFERQDAAAAARVVPVFVSIDPARDTPRVLKEFTGNFHPRMIGLTGTPEQIAAVAKDYAVYYRKGGTMPNGGYLMDHSRVAYLMGPKGEPIALLPHDGAPQAIAAELARWVH